MSADWRNHKAITVLIVAEVIECVVDVLLTLSGITCAHKAHWVRQRRGRSQLVTKHLSTNCVVDTSGVDGGGVDCYFGTIEQTRIGHGRGHFVDRVVFTTL